MIFKLFICVFLSNVFIQALPSTNVRGNNKKISCDVKISWYEEINEKAKRLYNEYYAKLAEIKLKPYDLNLLNSEHKKLENTVSEVFKRYDVDSDMINASVKEILCEKDIDWYQNMNVNLTRLVVDIGKELLNVLDHSESSFVQKKNVNIFFGKLINFLLIVVKPENQFKELVILEKEWKINENNSAKATLKAIPNKIANNVKLFQINEYTKITAMATGKRKISENEILPSISLSCICLIFICLAIVVGQVLARIQNDRSYLRI